ncbi:MAG: hypothetical protein PHU56_01695 [Candidatus Pacebacteria bacterium]|nr:hypothetical protein [Candidatus Paceibacterota bacterium]
MSVNSNSVKNFFQAVGQLFWKRMIFFFLLFLFVDFLIAGILLAKYYFVKPAAGSAQDFSTLLNQDLLNKTFIRWKEGQAVMKELPEKQYPDFFQKFRASSPAAKAVSPVPATPAATTSP